MRRQHLYLALVFAFLLGVKDGFVALWKDSASEPVKVFPYTVSSLPREDQLRLEQGIRIESKEELLALLEDYLS